MNVVLSVWPVVSIRTTAPGVGGGVRRPPPRGEPDAPGDPGVGLCATTPLLVQDSAPAAFRGGLSRVRRGGGDGNRRGTHIFCQPIDSAAVWNFLYDWQGRQRTCGRPSCLDGDRADPLRAPRWRRAYCALTRRGTGWTIHYRRAHTGWIQLARCALLGHRGFAILADWQDWECVYGKGDHKNKNERGRDGKRCDE